MKIIIFKMTAVLLLLAGGFSCSNNEDADDENMVSIKIQCNNTGAVDPNIVSIALPNLVDVVCYEYVSYPNYGGIPEAWSPHTWSITLIMPKGTDCTKLAPIITLTPGASITPESGTVHDFTKQVDWTLIVPDGSTVFYSAFAHVIK